MRKMRVSTNKGNPFDWFLNKFINFVLWHNCVVDDEEEAIKITARIMTRLGAVENKEGENE